MALLSSEGLAHGRHHGGPWKEPDDPDVSLSLLVNTVMSTGSSDVRQGALIPFRLDYDSMFSFSKLFFQSRGVDEFLRNLADWAPGQLFGNAVVDCGYPQEPQRDAFSCHFCVDVYEPYDYEPYEEITSPFLFRSCLDYLLPSEDLEPLMPSGPLGALTPSGHTGSYGLTRHLLGSGQPGGPGRPQPDDPDVSLSLFVKTVTGSFGDNHQGALLPFRLNYHAMVRFSKMLFRSSGGGMRAFLRSLADEAPLFGEAVLECSYQSRNPPFYCTLCVDRIVPF